MDTSDLLPSLAAGDLSETSGAELVAAIFRSRASGTLSLEGAAGDDIRVFFRAGDMCGCALFSGFRTLAQVLLEQDWVGALEIDASWAESEAKGKRHGQVLLERGLLTPAQLKAALGMQHRQNLAALLALTAGRYEWRGWEPPPPWTKEISTDPVGVIVDAFESDRLLARRSAILEWLGGVPARLSVDWEGLSSRIVLKPEDRRATALFARPRTVAQFVGSSGLPPEHAEALLATLLLVGCAEPHEGPIEAEPAAEPERAAPVEEDLPELDVIEDPGPAPARRPAGRMPEAEAIDRLERLDLEPEANEPLELETAGDEPLELETAGDEPLELETAGDEPLELETAEDEPLEPVSALPPRQEARADDGRATALRRKMRAQGLRNLGQGGAQTASAEALTEAGEAPGPQSGEQDAEAGRPSAPSPIDQRFIDEVRSRLRLTSRQTAYEVLGVAAASATDKIRAAYLELVKRFHPDRASAPGLAEVSDDLRALFDAIKEAYELVASPTSRESYDAALKGARTKGAGGGKGEAGTLVKMGEVLLKKRDFPGALEKFRRAVEVEANGDTLAALAWGLLNDPAATAAAKEESAALIQKALRAPGLTARTYYVAGVLWRTKDPESSLEAFRKALEVDPQHPDAALELRLLEMRQGKAAKKPGGGVLAQLLFGKRKG